MANGRLKDQSFNDLVKFEHLNWKKRSGANTKTQFPTKVGILSEDTRGSRNTSDRSSCSLANEEIEEN